MARIGYARVSSVGQSREVQLAKLVDCNKICQEKRSGAVGKRLQCAEQQMDGIQSAKARGVVFGRHKCLTRQQAAELQGRRRQGMRIGILMRDYRISKATVYRYLEGVRPAQPEEPPECV